MQSDLCRLYFRSSFASMTVSSVSATVPRSTCPFIYIFIISLEVENVTELMSEGGRLKIGCER